MRTLALAAALLGSTAILRMMPDAAGGDGGAPAAAPDPAFLSTVDALNKLDPDNDAHWTADGLPDVDVMEALTGNIWLSRGDINGFPIDRATAKASKDAAVPLVPPVPDPAPADAPAVPPDPTPPVAASPPPDAVPADPAPVDPPAPETPPATSPSQKIGRRRIVDLYFSEGHPYAESIGLVVKVADDGALNVYAFAPDGGAPGFFTGVRNRADVAAMPDGPDKNAAQSTTWDWPPLV